MFRFQLRELISKAALRIYGDALVSQDLDFSVTKPALPEHGDYAANIAFVIAKIVRKQPLEIAEAVAAELKKADLQFIATIAVASPGFINFFLAQEELIGTLKNILKKKDKFGRGAKKKETVVVEYSSPNIAKPLGVHHLRTTIIGQALINILRFTGRQVISLSFPGDWGTQFGLLIAGYKRWGDPIKLKKHPIDEMLNLYVRFAQAAKADPKLLEEGRKEFKKLEEGDKENRKLWKWFLGESLRDFDRVYKLLGAKIEHTIGESFYEPELKALIGDALEQGIARRGEDGSVIIPIPSSATPEIIQKSDGATIYTTRELAAIRHRLRKWKADKILYVAANQQTFHLAQVFRCAELLDYAKPGQLVHVKFGMVLAPGGKKFATREGKLIPLEDVLNEAIERSRKVVEKLNPKLSAKKKAAIAKAVGIGAVKFFDLSQHRHTDIVFDWDKMLNLGGASAPYLQYTYARLRSILRRQSQHRRHGYTQMRKRMGTDLLKEESELAILRQLIHFPEIVEDAATRYEPNLIAEYLLRLSEKANTFYESVPVLSAEKEVRGARLALVEAIAIVIKNGLNLLGIEAPEEM